VHSIRTWLIIVGVLAGCFSCRGSSDKKSEANAKQGAATTDAEPKANAVKANADAATGSADTKQVKQLRRIAKELAGLGITIDSDKIKARVLNLDAATKYLDKQQDVLFKPHHFTAFHTVATALGIPAGIDGKDLRRQTIEALTKTFAAVYDWESDSMLLLDTDASQLADKEQVLAHELAHAYQHKHWNLNNMAKATSVEQLKVVQCVIEGHAELVSSSMILKRAGKDLSAIDLAGGRNFLGKMRAAQAAQAHYALGTWLILRRVRSGALTLGTTKWPTLPASTEQVIHHEKRNDQPTVVALPEWPKAAGKATLLQENTYGELMLFVMLLEASQDGARAYVGATGWDGDRLSVFKTSKGIALMWRLVFDRVKDAKQVQKLLGARVAPRLNRRGRVIDITYAADTATAKALKETMAKFPAEFPEQPGDVTTAAAAEASWAKVVAKEPALVGKRWNHPGEGVSIPVRPGWAVQKYQGQKLLGRQKRGQLTHTVMVLGMPNPTGKTLAQTSEETKQYVKRIVALKLKSIKNIVISGVPALHARIDGRAPSSPARSVTNSIVFRRGNRLIYVIVSVMETEWESSKNDIAKLLAGIRLRK